MLPLLGSRGDLVLLRDSVEWEGRSLLKALIREAAHGGEQVRVLGCEVSEEAFREGLDPDTNRRLVYHDVFGDPRGGAGAGAGAAALGALRACLRGAEPGPCTLAVDSLSWLLLRAPCSALCQALGAPGRRGRVRVLGLLHEDLHGPGAAGALGSLAAAEVSVGGSGGRAAARVLRPQPTPRFSVLPDLSLRGLREAPGEARPRRPAPAPAAQAQPAPGLTFNLHLSEEEREARDALALPFHFSSEKQRALLRAARAPAAGRILYEPDDDDYLDHEDPDDDLDI